MKMNKILATLTIIALAFTACSDNVKTAEDASGVEVVKDATATSAKPFANPVIIYGSDFLTFFKSLRKTGQYEVMVAFTSDSCVAKHGADNLKDFYKDKYKNVSDLDLKNSVDNEDGTFTLLYVNKSFATQNAIDVTVTIENDSCKLVLPDDLSSISL